MDRRSFVKTAALVPLMVGCGPLASLEDGSMGVERGKETRLAAGEEPRRPFTAPIAATVVPYLSAECADQPEKVVLRAVAEQAGMGTAAWELRFLGRERGQTIPGRVLM